MKPATFLVPGIFLLVLGLGNALIGSIKSSEYKTVVRELSMMEKSDAPQILDDSPLTRLKLTAQVPARLEARRRKAITRRDFYNLVGFGGQVFVGISFFFILVGLVAHIRRVSDSPTPASQ